MMRNDESGPMNRVPHAPEDFHRALGYALVAFTEIDGALFTLFYALNAGETPDIEDARRIFYESWNFAVRLKVVARTAAARIGDPALRAEWDRTMADIESLKAQRNQLAHASSAASFEDDPTCGLVLVPVLGLPEQDPARTAERLDTRRIVALAIEFEDMADRITAFLERVAPGTDHGYGPGGSRSPMRRRRRA
jgi:hypothetical protein